MDQISHLIDEIQELSDINIINVLYPFLTVSHTVIITSPKPRMDNNPLVRTLYIDTDILSWSELDHMVSSLPNLEHIIIRVNSLIGGITKLVNIIKKGYTLFVVLVGAHCNNIANPSVFLREWDNCIPPDALHIYYQRDGPRPDPGPGPPLKLKILITEPYQAPRHTDPLV
jgi:hypothetical protein